MGEESMNAMGGDGEIIQPTPEIKLSRKDRRKAEQIRWKLIEILGSFYEAVSQPNKQLTEEEIRECFKKHNQKWVSVCHNNNLNKESKALFALEIQQTWARKQKKAAEQAEKSEAKKE